MKLRNVYATMAVMVLSWGCFFCISNAAGLSLAEESILKKLQTGVEIDGQTVCIIDNYINDIEEAMKMNQDDITPEQANKILLSIDEAYKIIQKKDIKSMGELLSSDSIDDIVTIAKRAINELDYYIFYNDTKGTISVANQKGEMIIKDRYIKEVGINIVAVIISGCVLTLFLSICVIIAVRENLLIVTSKSKDKKYHTRWSYNLGEK